MYRIKSFSLGGSACKSLIASAYWVYTTRRLSFSVGVTSPVSGVHSTRQQPPLLDLLHPGEPGVAAAAAAATSATTSGCSASAAGEAASTPCALAQAGAASPSRVSSATTYGRRSPYAAAWPISGCSTSRFSIEAGEMFSPPEVMISSFLRSSTDRNPSESSEPMSPVCSQPSASISCAVAPARLR